VRHGGPAKQCLWLGANRYRGSCRYSGANPNRFADSCVERYSLRADNAYAYAERTSFHTHGDANGDTYDNPYSHTYGDTNRDSCNAYAYTQRDADAYTKSATGHTQASTDSTS
jgi:hypothetical protein